MDASSLPTLPVSFMTALVSLLLLALVLRHAAGNPASRACFALLFCVFCLQAVLVGLRFGYDVKALAPLQRALPFMVGPLIYLGFRALADADRFRSGTVWPHGIAAGLPIALIWLLPLLTDPGALPPLAQNAVDGLIGLSFVIYLALLIRLYRGGVDAFEAAGFDSVQDLRRWHLAAILLLAFMLALDGAIALDFALSAGRRTPWLIAVGSAVIIPALLAAALLYPTGRQTAGGLTRASRERMQAEDDEADRAVIEALDDLFRSRALHHDPDLNLSRLARRLGLPARRVSAAVNRLRGLNVSQLVNDYRIADAARALAGSDRAIAEVMLAAGFRTKSNFNREFRRVTGESPLDYRRRHRA